MCIRDRSQFVCLDGFCSTTLNISCGVPQGSILGPLLFIIYLNDIAELKLNGKTNKVINKKKGSRLGFVFLRYFAEVNKKSRGY